MGKKSNLFYKFTIIVLSAIGIFLLFSSLVVYAYKQGQPKAAEQRFVDEFGNDEIVAPNFNTEDTEEENNIFGAPERTNFLIAGVDAITEGLTDVLIVGCFDTKTQQINLISIPRDTKITLDPKTTKRIEQNNYGTYNIVKVNSINNYVGKSDGMEYTRLEIENLLNIKIDYYVVVNTAAFREIVNALGGVKMTLERNYFYQDPLQDLYINLKAGEQILDGAAAEGLVRFRNDYVRGDEERIEVQQLFMKELVSQVLNRDSIIKNLPAITEQIFKHVRTDFSIGDAYLYLPYIDTLKGGNFHFQTLPGHGETVVDSNGKDVSYFFYDREETNALIADVFYGRKQNQEIDSPDEEELLQIKILNGSGKNNVAGEKQKELQEAGFNIAKIGTYDGERQSKTRIFVKNPNIGYDLLPYFKSASVELDTINITNDCDIVIVIGTNE